MLSCQHTTLCKMNDYLTHAIKIQYFGHLMWREDSLGKTLMLGKIEWGGEGDDRGWDGWMASPILWMWVWVNSRSWWWTGRPGVLQFMGSQRVEHSWATELNQNLWMHKHGVVSGDPGRLCRKVSANSTLQAELVVSSTKGLLGNTPVRASAFRECGDWSN